MNESTLMVVAEPGILVKDGLELIPIECGLHVVR